MRDRRTSARTLWRRGIPVGLCRVPVFRTAAKLLRCLTRAVSPALAIPFLALLFSFLLLLFPQRAFCQDVRENFVRCDTYLDSLGRHRTVSVQYYDGIGRPTVSATEYYTQIDNLAYRYEGNRLMGITERAPDAPYENAFGFRSGGAGDVDYEYNSDGALTRDPYKGVSVSYSRRGTPERAKFDSGSFTGWEYTADGVRLGTWWHTAVTGARGFAAETEEESTTGILAQNQSQAQAETAGASQSSPQAAPIYGYVENSREFAGNYVFEDGRLSKYLFDGGYIDIASGLNTAAYRFYVRDHLGSVRVVLDDDGNVLQQLYYHPFGGVWGDAGTNIGLQPWKYSGKEYAHRDGLDLYDYGARLYDPAAVRWTSPAPLCEKHYHISPYAFCNNNPINNIDPDGRAVVRGAVSAFKVSRRLWKAYKTAGVLTPENIGAAAQNELADFAGDVLTLFDGGSSLSDRARAAADLLVGINLNDNSRNGAKQTGKGTNKIEPNKGGGPPHGGKEHNAAIDQRANIVKKRKGVSNVRKNQKQTDKDGNTVGDNRPDLQYDEYDVHHNVEFDFRVSSSEKHRRVVTQNDPNAVNEFNIIKKRRK